MSSSETKVKLIMAAHLHTHFYFYPHTYTLGNVTYMREISLRNMSAFGTLIQFYISVSI